MPKLNLRKLKPGVSRRVHLLLAPFLWTSAGCLLIVRGFGWVARSGALWLVAAGLVLGTMKSLLILDNTARRGVERLQQFADGTCLGAVYSWKTWLLVALMMASGIVLRTVMEPGRIVGTLYIAVGWALIFSSRYGWSGWLEIVRHDPLR